MEPPVYRPFALLAFAAALGVGTPLGIAMLAWLYLGAPALTTEALLLHAHVQVFGFFGALIPGVAPHLLARFTGRPLAASPVIAWLAAALAAALGLRVAGAWAGAPASSAVAATIQTVVYAVFALRVWRALDPPPLAPLRAHLALASTWLAAACLAEIVLRASALAAGRGVPDVAAMRAVHAVGLLGGVLGWVLGVLLRAGPMFVADWRVPRPLVRAVPALLGAGVVLVAAGETGGLAAGAALARGGETLAVLAAVLVVVAGGALRRSPLGALPMLSRSPEEARLFRLAAASTLAAFALFATATAMALSATQPHVVADAARHLLTVGVLTTVVAAMTFRLVPVLERRALPWPAGRPVALVALAAAVVLRTAETLVAAGAPALAPLVVLSGPLVWLALAAVAANLVVAVCRAPSRR